MDHYSIDKHEMRNLIFNAEMALIDLKRFCHDNSMPLAQASERAAELNAAAANIYDALSPFTPARKIAAHG